MADMAGVAPDPSHDVDKGNMSSGDYYVLGLDLGQRWAAENAFDKDGRWLVTHIRSVIEKALEVDEVHDVYRLSAFIAAIYQDVVTIEEHRRTDAIAGFIWGATNPVVEDDD